MARKSWFVWEWRTPQNPGFVIMFPVKLAIFRVCVIVIAYMSLFTDGYSHFLLVNL